MCLWARWAQGSLDEEEQPGAQGWAWNPQNPTAV
jgi:hypothetical protein